MVVSMFSSASAALVASSNAWHFAQPAPSTLTPEVVFAASARAIFSGVQMLPQQQLFSSFFLLNNPIVNDLLRLNQNKLKRIEQVANNDNANRTNANKECQQFGFHSLAEHDKGRQGQGSNSHHKGKNGPQLCPLRK